MFRAPATLFSPDEACFFVDIIFYISYRLLVYEYIDNGNLEQWLHGDVGPVSPLTWEVRMKIAVGAARG